MEPVGREGGESPHLAHCNRGSVQGVQSSHDHGDHPCLFKSKHPSNSCPGRACGVSQTSPMSFGEEGLYIQSAVPRAHCGG